MRKEIKILGVMAIAVIVGALIGASYYRTSVQEERITPVSNTSGSSGSQSTANAEALIRPDSPTLGAADAPVTIVEFLDPECESCAAFAPVVKRIMKDYEGKIRLVVRYMPLHPNSLTAATFTEAAGEQGKYWQAQEFLFQKQPEWGTKHGHGAEQQPDINSLFKKYAADLGLDMNKMNAVFAENKYKAKVERDLQDGKTLSVTQTPTFFINGRRLARLNEADLKALIQAELMR